MAWLRCSTEVFPNRSILHQLEDQLVLFAVINITSNKHCKISAITDMAFLKCLRKRGKSSQLLHRSKASSRKRHTQVTETMSSKVRFMRNG